MKKLVFMFVAMAAISFASCGNGEKAAEGADTTATDTPAVVAADSSADSVSAADAAPADSAVEAPAAE